MSAGDRDDRTHAHLLLTKLVLVLIEPSLVLSPPSRMASTSMAPFAEPAPGRTCSHLGAVECAPHAITDRPAVHAVALLLRM